VTPRGPVLARLDRPRAPATRLAVVADPHVADEDATGTWKVYHRSAQRFASALRNASAVDADAVVVPGDLTRDGRPGEFDRVDALLSGTDRPVVAVPGNHDVPKVTDDHETPSVSVFANRYGDGGFPAVREVGGLTLVGVNTAGGDGRLTGTHEGGLTADQVARVDAALADAREAVVVGHHPLSGPANHVSPVPPTPLHPPMESADDLVAVLDRHDVPLAVTGHNHWPSLSALGCAWELGAPGACSLPPSMLVLDVTPTGTTVSLVPLADRDGLEEAYLHAAAGSERSRAIADRVAAGHLEDLPFVDCHGGTGTRHDASLPRGGLVD